MTKLLNKPLKIFIVFTCTVLACSIPVYFYLVESIWIDELDDHNEHLKEQIQKRFDTGSVEELNAKIVLWNQIQVNSQIVLLNRTHKDSLYLIERKIEDGGEQEIERFRGLLSVITLGGKSYDLRIETNVEEVDETVFSISAITFVFILLLITGFILLNRRLSKRIWQPFLNTLDQLKQFDLNSNAGISFSTTDIREFSELNETLLKLIDNNVRIYKQQKEFTQNASHELQTPLALLKSRLDLLIQDTSLTPEQRKIIESLDSSISRVGRINKNLLLLTGIENKQYETEQVDLTAITRSLAHNFIDFALSKGCDMVVSAQENVSVKANESLVEIMVSNLLSNTIRHGITGSQINVTLTNQALVVCNMGHSSLDANNLFRRFISATPNNPGTGLGLAIVKEISDKYNWKVTYAFINNQHVFSIFFKF